MNDYYDKIFDFNKDRAPKMSNSSYLEELSGLLNSAASRLDSKKYYLFENEYYLSNHPDEPNTSYSEFIREFRNSFFNGASDKINIIRGRAGIGKTMFFEQGVQLLIRKNEHRDRYIRLGVDFKNIDAKKDVSYYEKYIYVSLRDNAIDAIRLLGDSFFVNFDEKYEKYLGCSRIDTPYSYMFPVKFFCDEIYRRYEKPCIIIFDNIDLACVKTQINVFKATANIVQQLNTYMINNGSANKHCIYFAMRPETLMHSEEARLGHVINFPLPNILSISLEIIKKSLLEAAKEKDNEKKLICEVEFYSLINSEKVKVRSFNDIAVYFINLLEYYLKNIWDNNDFIKRRLGSSENFHCSIVNYNIRTFLSFFADVISNGGFKPLTKKFNETSICHYTVFDYIEMIIRGRWHVHPGNTYMDGEGGNKAPIVFNVFDTVLWDNTQENKCKHFMLNIRILQYLDLKSNGEKIFYGELKRSLSAFFDENHIEKAIKKMIHIRIIYSFEEGDENIASKNHWEKVYVSDATELSLTPIGKFYIEKFIYEFEYLYQMALSSLMLQEFVKELQINDCWQTEKELTVLYFLKSVFSILIYNVNAYKGEMDSFKRLFCKDDINSSKPYRKMLDSFRTVMNIKVQHAEKNETNRIEKLHAILQQANDLFEKAEHYFSSILGE